MLAKFVPIAPIDGWLPGSLSSPGNVPFAEAPGAVQHQDPLVRGEMLIQ